MSVFNSSGGMGYHLRALRYQNSLWKPFRQSIENWLETFTWPDELILIGPSGGYSLPTRFLKKFEQITAFEPDLLARRIFEFRHGIRPEWKAGMAFSVQGIKEALAAKPQAAVLFSNVLGQLQFFEKQAEDILSDLKKWNFAEVGSPLIVSYHDRWSGSIRPAFQMPLRQEQPILKNDGILALYPERQTGELVDHLTGGLFANSPPYTYFYWEITPKNFHVIEGAVLQKPTIRK